MKLTGFETQIVELPRESGPLGASAMFVTLKLRTDDGIEGIGYAGFTSALMMKALEETLDALTEQTIGSNPMMIEAIGAKLLALGGGGSPSGLVTRAVSAIDVALWDIRGKALGQPVYRLDFVEMNPDTREFQRLCHAVRELLERRIDQFRRILIQFGRGLPG